MPAAPPPATPPYPSTPPRPMVPRDVRNRSTTAATFEYLLELILRGELPPGKVLREKALCDELRVSRTVVREALARLAQLRVLAMKQGGDTTVLDYRKTGGLDLLPWMLRRSDLHVDPQVLRSGVEMRAALVPEIAAMCARRSAAPVHEQLIRIAAQLEKVADLERLQAMSLQFWGIAVEATENIAYQLAFNTLRDAIETLGVHLAMIMDVELRDAAGYQAIAKAIARGDEAAARKAAEAHVEIGLAKLGQPKKKERR